MLGQRVGADVDVVDEVLDGEPYGHVLLVEHDDGVLAVRGEDGAVAVEEVQQGRQERGEEPLQPGVRGEAGALDQLRGERAARRIRMEEGGERAGTFARREAGRQGLPPDRAEDLLVLVGRFGEVVVQRVLHGDGGDLAEKDDPAGVAQEGVVLAQPLDPGGDRGCGEGPLGRQAAPDQGVEDGERELHGVPLGPLHVRERADGLLREAGVPVGVQGHDVAVGDGRGEERHDPLVPLPGVHGEVEVVPRVVPPGAQHLGEGVPDVPVELMRRTTARGCRRGPLPGTARCGC